MRRLGRTGLLVSELCLGAMTFGENQWGVGGLQQGDADRMVGLCLQDGVNFFDTADVYSNGAAEEILGRALRHRRHEVVLATKVRGRTGSGPNDVGLSRGHIMDSIEQSLRRLGTDYIDLYQVHGWDQETPLEETLRALDDLVRAGKVRYIGLSNFAAWQIARALGIAERDGLARFQSAQMHYSLLCRDIEHEVVPLALDQGLGILVWSPLSGGFLSGKYRPRESAPPGSRLGTEATDFPPFNRELGYQVVEKLRAIASGHNATPAQVALAWLLAQPAVTSVIIGARRMEQLEDNLRAMELRLPAAAIEELNELTRPAVLYPGWMIANQNREK